MKVKDLIDALNDFDPDSEVIIGMWQRYGSDFAIEIEDVEEFNVRSFWGDDPEEPYVALIEGKQIGTIYEEEG